MPNFQGKLPDGTHTAKHFISRAHSEKRKRKIMGLRLDPLPEHCAIYHCDFRALAERHGNLDGKVDVVLTDVLWGAQYSSDWLELAELSLRWLKPEGLFASWCGQATLPLMLETLAKVSGLYYRHTFVAERPRGSNCAPELNGIVSFWRPVVVYSRAKDFRFSRVTDIVMSSTVTHNKEWHPYQRDVGEVSQMLERLTVPGDLVVDPCLGSGTTALACLQAKGGLRRFLGCEIEESHYRAAHGRVSMHLRDEEQHKAG
jgi:hypothetical protein